MGLGPEGQLLRAAAGAGPPKTKGISPALHVHTFSMKNPFRWVQEGQLTWSLGWLMVSFKEEIGGFLYSQPFSPEFLSFSSSILVLLASLGPKVAGQLVAKEMSYYTEGK